MDASDLPMAMVSSPECNEESWTTLPVDEPEKNCTVILAEPAAVAAVSDCLSAWLADPDAPTATEAEAPDVTARLSSRQAATVSPFRAAFEVRAARECSCRRHSTPRPPSQSPVHGPFTGRSRATAVECCDPEDPPGATWLITGKVGGSIFPLPPRIRVCTEIRASMLRCYGDAGGRSSRIRFWTLPLTS